VLTMRSMCNLNLAPNVAQAATCIVLDYT